MIRAASVAMLPRFGQISPPGHGRLMSWHDAHGSVSYSLAPRAASPGATAGCVGHRQTA
jgi:hypothetical protein